MNIGEKIKVIRNFRGLTQRELGIKIGLDKKSADNRMAQYETNYRVPKKETLLMIAEVLDVSPLNFITEVSGSAEEIMQTFFWLDESSRGAINLFQLVKNTGKANSSDDTAVRYNDSDDWPAHPPVGIWFKYGIVDEFLREWLVRSNQLKAGEITRDEYFEWKLNWPRTCDRRGKDKPEKQWRKSE